MAWPPLVGRNPPLEWTTDDTDEHGLYGAPTVLCSQRRLRPFLCWVRMGSAVRAAPITPRDPQKTIDLNGVLSYCAL